MLRIICGWFFGELLLSFWIENRIGLLFLKFLIFIGWGLYFFFLKKILSVKGFFLFFWNVDVLEMLWSKFCIFVRVVFFFIIKCNDFLMNIVDIIFRLVRVDINVKIWNDFSLIFEKRRVRIEINFVMGVLVKKRV